MKQNIKILLKKMKKIALKEREVPKASIDYSNKSMSINILKSTTQLEIVKY